MALVINEEQQMLKSSAKELLKEKGAIEKLRHLRDTNDKLGYDPDLWQEMVEMGWTSLIIPESYGGLDFGYTGLGQVLEETGRTLTASPLLSTALMGTTAINLGGNVLQKEMWLPQIAEGKLITTLAFEEGRHHNPEHINMTAEQKGDAFVLNGTKTNVIDGHIADQLIVAVQASTGIELFVVDTATAGVSVERVIMMDSRNMATVHFEHVNISKNTKLDEYASGDALLERTFDIARIGLAAEMLGGTQEAFARTIAYLKEREQFGKKIGSFQALQHRAAHLFCEIEMCKSIVIKALKAIDSDSKDIPKLASLAKAKLGQTYQLASAEGIQMFGGIGMTDDEEIGFFLKRAKVAQQLLGTSNFHLDRLAKMRGY